MIVNDALPSVQRIPTMYGLAVVPTNHRRYRVRITRTHYVGADSAHDAHPMGLGL